MRLYGLHSGRNNMNALIARSILYNTPKGKKKEKVKLTEKEQSICIILYICLFFIIMFLMKGC